MARKLSIAYFVHTMRSDWNNGNAHFQRGLVRALGQLGHRVTCFEQEHDWSMDNLLLEERGRESITQFAAVYPDIRIVCYSGRCDGLREELRNVDVVIVHEWNSPELVQTVLMLRDELGFLALFHDTHHRASSSPEQMSGMQVARFDGVLAFGEALREIYVRTFGIERAWTFHEAADTTVFAPGSSERTIDAVWIGNWGDGERSREIREYFVRPAARLAQRRLIAYGVRYPPDGLDALSAAGIQYKGYLPNLQAPAVYDSARLTVHIPRQQYRDAMTGIPTIRMFEALACGVPLISAPWNDVERLFCPGDYLMARNGDEMASAMEHLILNPGAAADQAARGLETIRKRHTCRHRAEQLEAICEEVLAA